MRYKAIFFIIIVLWFAGVSRVEGQEPHGESHELGGDDVINVTGLSGILSDSQKAGWLVSIPITYTEDFTVGHALVYSGTGWVTVNLGDHVGGVMFPEITDYDIMYGLAALTVTLFVGAAVRQQTIALWCLIVVVLLRLHTEPVALNAMLVVILGAALFNKFVGAAMR